MNLEDLEKEARLEAIRELKIQYSDRLDYLKKLEEYEKKQTNKNDITTNK